jgi:hypothetical protein
LRCSHDLDGKSLGQRHDLGGPLSILYLKCLWDAVLRYFYGS